MPRIALIQAKTSLIIFRRTGCYFKTQIIRYYGLNSQLLRTKVCYSSNELITGLLKVKVGSSNVSIVRISGMQIPTVQYSLVFAT